MLGSQKDNLVEFKQSKDYSGFLSVNTFKLCPKIGSVHRLYIFFKYIEPTTNGESYFVSNNIIEATYLVIYIVPKKS